MEFDRESLQDVINEVTEANENNEDLRPTNPVLVYDYETGEFAIESENNTKKHICFLLWDHKEWSTAIAVLGNGHANDLGDGYIKQLIIHEYV